jgi:GNAT superfamily N-acetyltransferase
MRIEAVNHIDGRLLHDLYASVGWSAYTQDMDRLVTAFENADFVAGAWIDESLVGLIRVLSDDVSIAYIQDILVRPSHQRQGVGRGLLEAALTRYAHVRQKVLLTDDRPEQLNFYASLGFANTRDLVKTPLNAFVIIEGAELS